MRPKPHLLLVVLLACCAPAPRAPELTLRPLAPGNWSVVARARNDVLLLRTRTAESNVPRSARAVGDTLPTVATLRAGQLTPVLARPVQAGQFALGRARVGASLLYFGWPGGPPLAQSFADRRAYLFSADDAVWLFRAPDFVTRLTADSVGVYRRVELARGQREGEVILYWAEDPLWSPDATLISYLTNREAVLTGTAGQSIWLISTARRTERPLLADSGVSYRHAGWLGGELIYIEDAPGVWSIDPQTLRRRKLSDGYVSGTSASGSALAIRASNTLTVRTLRRRLIVPLGANTEAGQGTFSPDTRYFATFIATDAGSTRFLLLVDIIERIAVRQALPAGFGTSTPPLWLDNRSILINGVQRPARAQAWLLTVG